MDQPFPTSDPALLDLLDHVVDVEGKIGAALAALAPLDGRDVLLLDPDRGFRAAELRRHGARIQTLDGGVGAGLADRPPASVDLLVAFFTGLGLGAAAAPATLAGLSRVVRSGGAIALVEAYGRDDTTHLFADPARDSRLKAASDRRGPMLEAGFRVRVLHCWWTFADLGAMQAALVALFPATGAAVAATLHRPRFSFKAAVYHRLVERP